MSTDKVILDRIERLEKLVDGLGEAYNNLSKVVYTATDDDYSISTSVDNKTVLKRIQDLIVWLNENKKKSIQNETLSDLLYAVLTSVDFDINKIINKI